MTILFGVLVLLRAQNFGLGEFAPALFTWTTAAYLSAALLFRLWLTRDRRYFSLQLSAQVAADVIALTLLMYASGGIRSGLGVMMLISLAGAALVADRRMTLFYAALATIAVLLEHSYWVLYSDVAVSAFMQPGLLSVGFFASALTTNWLAGLLANQLRINELVIRDVQDGVMVVDPIGVVRQHNRQSEALLDAAGVGVAPIERYSAALGERYLAWRDAPVRSASIISVGELGRRLRVRMIEAGVEGASYTLIFLEDLSRLEEEARQLKLVALGRLTANIAHEIRNPLSAITHAADLVREENRAEGRDRLTRIIRDNAYRLDRMVRDILELSRRDRVHAEPIPLAGFLATFIDEFARNEGVPREALVFVVTGDPIVEVDRVHFNQILWNLVRNAWRHSSQSAGAVQVRVEEQVNRLELHVIDDGPGVAKDHVGQLFEPFFTTFSTGTGLGLYIARELAAANGATLDYVVQPRGADFRLQWPGPRH